MAHFASPASLDAVICGMRVEITDGLLQFGTGSPDSLITDPT